jgi:hypothetical protein
MKHASGWTLARIGKTGLTLVAAAIGAAVLMNSSCNLTDKAPTVPVISGPSSGVVGVAVTFKATATDPENDSIAFQFDWGDSSTIAWTTLIASGETASVQHIYSDSGTFLVKAKAKDVKGKESAFSDSVAVSVLRSVANYPDTNLGWVETQFDNSWCTITPDGSLVCAANVEHDSITLIRVSDRKVLPPLDVGATTFDVAVSPDGSHMYASLIDSGGLAVVDLQSLTLDTVVRMGKQSYGVTVTPNGQRILVCSPHEGLVFALNAQDLSQMDSIDVGDVCWYSAVSPDGRTAYVSVGKHSLAVVDLDSGRLVKYLPNLGTPARIVMSPDGTRLYMQDVDVMGIRVVSLPDGVEITRLDLQVPGDGDVMLSPDGNLLIASADYGLEYVDTRTWAVVCSLPCGAYAGLAARPQFDSLNAVEQARTFVIGRRQ